MRLEVRTLVERATRWLVNQRWHTDAEGTIDQFGTGVAKVVRGLPDTLAGRELTGWSSGATGCARRRARRAGLRVAALPPAYGALAIVEVARRRDRDPLEVARVHCALGQRLGMGCSTSG